MTERSLVALPLSFAAAVIAGFLVSLALSPFLGGIGNWNLLVVVVLWAALYAPTRRWMI